MPELPEVETVARELRLVLPGLKIESLTAIYPKSFENRAAQYSLTQTISEISRQGKYLIFRLDNTFLIAHLRMTGVFSFHTGSESTGKYCRVLIRFTDHSQLQFLDTRKFGRIWHVAEISEITGQLGKDALDPYWTEKTFSTALNASRQGIKALLLGQSVISGLGNIYTDEILFASGIHPLSISATIPARKKIELFQNIHATLRFAIGQMGSTISDYRTVNGESGNFQNYFRVYAQTGKPCPQCARPIQRIRAAGRSTHYCPYCQKLSK